jgi:hypothetical protein
MNQFVIRKLVFIILAVSVLAIASFFIIGPAELSESLGFRLRQAGLIPDDKFTVRDETSGIAGAQLFRFDENGRLKYSQSDSFIPLNNPEWRASAEADHMKPEDPVLGLHIDGRSWAIPWWIIKNHHVANLTLDGQPVMIAFCELCSGGVAFDPVVNGRRLNFRQEGQYNGSILLADYETKSYWAPFTGEALEGPLKGTTLNQMKLVQCRWKQWLELYPRSWIAYGPESLRRGHGASYTPGDHDNSTFMHLLLRPIDKRRPGNEGVLGVAIRDQTRAYPLSALDARAVDGEPSVVVNDTLGRDEIVIFHQRGSWLTTVFNRQLDGETLQFALDKDGRFTDSAYHSHWSYDGEALDGAAAGRKLSYVRSQVEEWYIWAAFHPATSIFESWPSKAR